MQPPLDIELLREALTMDPAGSGPDQLGLLRAKSVALRNLVRTLSRRAELEVDEVFDQALAQTCVALDCPMACLHLVDEDQKRLFMVSIAGMDFMRARSWEKLSLDGSSPPAWVCRHGHILELNGEDAPSGLARLVCVPVQGYEVTVGTLSYLWPQAPRLDLDLDRNPFLETVSLLLGVVIERRGLVAEMVDNMNRILELKRQEEERAKELDEVNRQLKKANEALARLSITDGLTGLYNRRHLMNNLEQEVARARRLEMPLSLIMADIDRFKNLNDTLGHQAGDQALRHFAEWLTASVRQVDLVGRYGGEEFAVVLTNCDLSNARKVAEKIRRTVARESRVAPFDAVDGFTVSLGVAQLTPEQEPSQLLAAADQALYRAKHGGRDRVELAE